MTEFKPDSIEIQVVGFYLLGNLSRFPFFKRRDGMSVSFDDFLVVGISSRALFNLELANQIFEKKDWMRIGIINWLMKKRSLEQALAFLW